MALKLNFEEYYILTILDWKLNKDNIALFLLSTFFQFFFREVD